METKEFKDLIDSLIENNLVESVFFQMKQLYKLLEVEKRLVNLQKLDYCIHKLNELKIKYSDSL